MKTTPPRWYRMGAYEEECAAWYEATRVQAWEDIWLPCSWDPSVYRNPRTGELCVLVDEPHVETDL